MIEPGPADAAFTFPTVPSADGKAEPSGKGLTAVLVTHGMGQQLSYDTLASVVDGLEKAPGRDWSVVDRRMALVRAGETNLRRIELTLARDVPGEERADARRVHVYEAYWAPLTEGKVGLRDVVWFLGRAARNGLRVGGGPQWRWLFGEWRAFPPIPGATVAFAMAILVLAGLALMNLASFAVVGLFRLPVPVPEANLVRLEAELTFGLAAFLLLVGLLGAWIGGATVAVLRARAAGADGGLEPVTAGGMSVVAWALGGATAFTVAGLSTGAAYATCIRATDCAPTAEVRAMALLGVSLLFFAGFLFLRYSKIIGGAAALALLAAAADALAPAWSFPLLPLLAALAGLAAAVVMAVVDARRSGAERGSQLHHRAFFATALLAHGALSVGLALAPVLAPGDEGRLLAGLAGLVTVSAVAGMAYAALAARNAPAPRAAPTNRRALPAILGVALAVLLSLPVVVLATALMALPTGTRTLVAWGLVAVVAIVVRQVVKQYVGDVAAYVSPHTLDRFDDLREAIRARVKKVADAVYGMRTEDGSRLYYDRVILVGHSLGSVVTYDTLNALLRDDLHAVAAPPSPDRDRPSDHPRAVAARTPVFVTFGSPLDRTAFVFATQRTGNETGPALASLGQPLIAFPETRAGLKWFNVHSRADIISSALTYYDVPNDPASPGRVENEEDPLAATPLLGHNEYWGNGKVWRHVVDGVFAS